MIIDINESGFKNYILELAKQQYPNLPPDAEIVVNWPTDSDSRFWVDILSEQHCKETDDSDYDEPPNGEPVFGQYLLVSNELLQKHSPEFFDEFVSKNL